MIVVSLNRSYPNLIDDVKARTAPIASIQLEGFTRGEWPRMSAKLTEGYLDFVVGTWADIIVSAFPTNRVEETAGGRMKFEFGTDGEAPDYLRSMFTSNVDVDPAEWLIGCPMPGGPWKRGEARGTRRYSLDDYLSDYPALAERRAENFGGRMATHLLEHFAGMRSIDRADYPALSDESSAAAPAATDVTVVRQPGGTVIVTIPTGTRAQILIEP